MLNFTYRPVGQRHCLAMDGMTQAQLTLLLTKNKFNYAKVWYNCHCQNGETTSPQQWLNYFSGKKIKHSWHARIIDDWDDAAQLMSDASFSPNQQERTCSQRARRTRSTLSKLNYLTSNLIELWIPFTVAFSVKHRWHFLVVCQNCMAQVICHILGCETFCRYGKKGKRYYSWHC